MARLFPTWRKLNRRKLLPPLSISKSIDSIELLIVQTLLVIVNRIFKCSRMPYTDRERKEIVEAIVRRQAHRILKVHFAQDLTLSTTLSTTLP